MKKKKTETERLNITLHCYKLRVVEMACPENLAA